MNEKGISALLRLVSGIKRRKNKHLINCFDTVSIFLVKSYCGTLSRKCRRASQMTKHVGLCPIIRMVNTSFIFGSATLENGCCEQANPDKYLKKKKKIIGYEKVDGVCKEKGWGGSMVQGSCLWGKGGVNWKCSFQGRPTNGNMGNNASTLRLKGKGEKST
jgi:hypothetical protein